MHIHHLLKLSVFVTLCTLISCSPDEKAEESGGGTVTVRLPGEPDMLNPARSASAYATQIESQIFLPLAELNPYDYTLEPLLVTSIPKGEDITSGPDSGGVRFHYTLRPEARWEDGTPVTSEDYAFTIKMALNPLVDVAQWRAFLTTISDVTIDPGDPLQFDVTVGEQYMLADLVTCNFNIYPRHIYDAEDLLGQFSVRDLTDPAIADSLAKANPALQQFADSFMQSRFAHEIVVGNGPYKLTSWETGQRILLERVTDWWGDQIKPRPLLLQAYPDQIVYEFVPDENTAITMLKAGSIDVISEVSPGVFTEMRADSGYQSTLDFYTPKLLVYNYLELNNHNPILKDKQVRKALAMVVDCDAMVENVALGMATRVTGPFNPEVNYYNKEVPPVPFDPDAARSLLTGAGWSDTNGNGTLDKVIDGKRTECVLNITVTQKAEGQTVAALLKENAAKVGIGINVVTRDGASLQQDVRSRNFDIVPLRRSSPVTIDDPYQNWHSASDAPGGSNRSGFQNAQADSLIAVIRSTENEDERIASYKALHALIAEEQPVIFLYMPLERLIVRKGFEMQPSMRKPGYFEQLFKLRDPGSQPSRPQG